MSIKDNLINDIIKQVDTINKKNKKTKSYTLDYLIILIFFIPIIFSILSSYYFNGLYGMEVSKIGLFFFVVGLVNFFSLILNKIENTQGIINGVVNQIFQNKDKLNSLTNKELENTYKYLEKITFLKSLMEAKEFYNINNDLFKGNKKIKEEFLNKIKLFLTDEELENFKLNDYDDFSGIDSINNIIQRQYKKNISKIDYNLKLDDRIKKNEKLIFKYKDNSIINDDLLNITKDTIELLKYPLKK